MSHSLETAPTLQPARTQSVGGTGILPVRSDSNGQDARATIKTLKVCIIGLKCFDHIAEKPVPQYLGGIETQLAVLAKGLRRVGCEVSLITFDHGQAECQTYDGVKIFKSYSPSGGVRGVRFFSRVSRLWSAMRQADAD